jgi:hypothetical protein
MTHERSRAPDLPRDPDRTRDDADEPAKRKRTDEDPNPWTREGPDAPDAADIDAPDEQL